MPRISDEWLLTSIYLYPDQETAESGSEYGGSGFIVAYPSADHKRHHLYAVTNSHVISTDNPVIRLNVKGNKLDYVPTVANVWARSKTADIAVHPLNLSGVDIEHAAIGVDMFIDHGRISGKGMGHGDECYVVGRFISHEGKQQNRPTVRFGAIAGMPDPGDGVYNEHLGVDEEVFLVEVHTIPGYSGSPVFVYIPAGSEHIQSNGKKVVTARQRGPWLLGIDCQHLLTYEDVVQKNTYAETPLLAQVSSGMMCVSPAWHLKDLLDNNATLIEMRDEQEQHWKKPKKPTGKTKNQG